jgi:hypothetical protein
LACLGRSLGRDMPGDRPASLSGGLGYRDADATRSSFLEAVRAQRTACGAALLCCRHREGYERAQRHRRSLPQGRCRSPGLLKLTHRPAETEWTGRQPVGVCELAQTWRSSGRDMPDDRPTFRCVSHGSFTPTQPGPRNRRIRSAGRTRTLLTPPGRVAMAREPRAPEAVKHVSGHPSAAGKRRRRRQLRTRRDTYRRPLDVR